MSSKKDEEQVINTNKFNLTRGRLLALILILLIMVAFFIVRGRGSSVPDDKIIIHQAPLFKESSEILDLHLQNDFLVDKAYHIDSNEKIEYEVSFQEWHHGQLLLDSLDNFNGDRESASIMTDQTNQLTFSIDNGDDGTHITYGIHRANTSGEWQKTSTFNEFQGENTFEINVSTNAVDANQEVVLWGFGMWDDRSNMDISHGAKSIRNADKGLILRLVPLDNNGHKGVEN